MRKISENVYAETKFRRFNCGFVVASEKDIIATTEDIPLADDERAHLIMNKKLFYHLPCCIALVSFLKMEYWSG